MKDDSAVPHIVDDRMPRWLARFIERRQINIVLITRKNAPKKPETLERRRRLIIDFIMLTQRRASPVPPGRAIDMLCARYGYSFLTTVNYLKDARALL